MFSRDPLQNPDLLKPKTYRVTDTVMAQLATLILGALGGAAVISIVFTNYTVLQNEQIEWELLVGLNLFPTLIYGLSLITDIHAQFRGALLPPKGTLSWSQEFAVLALVPGIIALVGLRNGAILPVLYRLLYFAVLAFLLTLIHRGVQSFVLKLWGFDQKRRSWLVSHEASLLACQLGVLPYREKVLAIWRLITFCTGAISCSVWLLIRMMNTSNFNSQANFRLNVLFLGMIGLCGLGIWATSRTIGRIKFDITEGKIDKTKLPFHFRKSSNYIIYCEGRFFISSDDIWFVLQSGQKYRLWHIPYYGSTKIIAYEQIGYKERMWSTEL